jgi:DNA-binding CsgD family transcriptional regulator
VNFHMANAMRKLDVVSRQHGIGKAALQRLIQPKPF